MTTCTQCGIRTDYLCNGVGCGCDCHDEPVNDVLIEAGQIERGETMKIATGLHLAAVTQLVREAAIYMSGDDDHIDVRDWLKEAKKVL